MRRKAYKEQSSYSRILFSRGSVVRFSVISQSVVFSWYVDINV